MTLTYLSGYIFLVAFSQFACGESHFVVKSSDSPQEPAKPAVQIHSDRLQKLLDSPSISPYAIENYIKESAESDEEFVDFKPIWERLNNLKTDDDVISEDDREIFNGFKPSFTRWQVELIDIPDSYNQINRVVVKIMIYGGSYRRFLIFKKENASIPQADWHFTGHFDISFPKGAPDLQQFHQVYSSKNGLCLILREVGCWGTGVFRGDEIWYRIDTEPPQEVLDYPIEGHQVNGFINDVAYKSRSKSRTNKDGSLIREITYRVSFGDAFIPDLHWLFTKSCKASFHWDKKKGEFIFAPEMSIVSQEEMNRGFQGQNEDDFFRYNFDTLVQSAKTANSEQRAWLENALHKMTDESQKKRLQIVLGH